jgi:hypothetical protein
MFRDKAIRLVVNQPCRILNEIKAFDVDGNVIEYNENEVLEKIEELQAEYEANQYQRDRAEQYPSTADQLDMLYHQGIEGWKAEIKKVKDAHPKPEST